MPFFQLQTRSKPEIKDRVSRPARPGFGRPVAGVRVSSPKEPLEREAERAAAVVMRETAGPHHSAPERTPHPPAGTGGLPLRAADLSFFEPRFCHDFSRVRVHADRGAAESAERLHARAFTRGGDIAFGAGQYQPETPAGRKLLAHELAHVVQAASADTIHRQEDDRDPQNEEDRPGLEKTVYFDAGQSWANRVEDGLSFNSYASQLREGLEDARETGIRLRVTGYASIEETNAADLALRRAEFVRQKLVEFHVPDLMILIDSSPGPDGTHAVAEKNQRVEVEPIRPDLPELTYSSGVLNSCDDTAEQKIEEAYKDARAILDKAIAKSMGGRTTSPYRVILRVTNSEQEGQQQDNLALRTRRSNEIRKSLEQLVPLAVTIDTQVNYTPPERDTTAGYADVSVDRKSANDPDMLNAVFGPFSYAFEPGSVELENEVAFLSDSFEIQDFLAERAVPDLAIAEVKRFFNITSNEEARQALIQVAADLMVIRSALDDARHFQCPLFCDAHAKTGFERDADIKFCPSGLGQEPLQLAETLIHELAHSQLKHKDILYIDEQGSASHWGDHAGMIRLSEAELTSADSSDLLKNADSLSSYAYFLATRDL